MKMFNLKAPKAGAYEKFKDAPGDLLPLKEIENDWKINDDSPDPRGNLLVDSEGRRLGIIQDILVSRSEEQAFFAVVETADKPSAGQNYLLPISALHKLDDDGKTYGPYRREDFDGAPVWTVEDRAIGHKSFQHWSKIKVK